MLIHSEMISEAGTLYNEDVAGLSTSYAWILDGATGLNKTVYLPSTSNARWLVDTWQAFLLENATESTSVDELLEKGHRHIEGQHLEISEGKEIDKLSSPTAGMALLKWHPDGFEYAIWGDCQIWVRHGGHVELIKDDRINRLDEVAMQAMKGFLREGYSKEQAREAINDLLIENRMKANVEEGYWVLGLSADCLNHTLKGKFKFDGVDGVYEVLMMSDGYYALVDKYDCCNEVQLFEWAKDKGLRSLYESLRDVEEKDGEMTAYPRFKKSDDASAIYLQLQSEHFQR